MEFIIDPSSFGIDLNNFETAIVSHHGLERKILLLRHSLFVIIFRKQISRLFLPDCFLGINISGRAKIIEWKLDTAMMMCKKSSDAYLFIRDIINSGGKQCTLFSPICMI
jgi:hypothetical protein